jgi:hypothetical protein
MFPGKHKLRRSWKWWCLAVAIAVLVATVIFTLAGRTSYGPVDYSFVERLKSAKHVRSEMPAPSQTLSFARNVGLKTAALNAIGRELRDVRDAAGGYPESVFHLLAHFEFGEILWVDEWTNFPVKLPPSPLPYAVVAPRHKAVKAFLSALHASGGCLVRAGKHRYLVAKVSDREKYEAAIRELGWLEGKQPPWDEPDQARTSKAEPKD